MSKVKRKYLSAYIPEAKPKETPKRSGTKSDGRIGEIEDAIKAFNDLLAKQNRDNLDALYNIDMDNMSSSMRRLFQSYEDDITSAHSSIETWANEMEAGFSAVAQWQKTVENGTISSIASINAKADANGAQITQLAAWQKTADEDIDGLVTTTAVIKAIADANGASIEQIVEAVGADGEVNAASIITAVNNDTSEVKINADHLDVDAIAIFRNTETGEGVTTISGDDIVLISDPYGDSISGLTFYKWRYTGEELNEDANELDNMFRIRTIDNETSNDNRARYAAQIQTLSTYEDDVKYNVALKLVSNGSMSLESGHSLYQFAEAYLTLDAAYNTRINANMSYADACMDIGYAAANNSYVFCKEGIYYVDSDGNAQLVWNPD